jgi:5-(carboxyamino)imidazole ribonucleotide synthase
MFNPNRKTIGILGGGQLGRMLIQSGIDLNLRFHILDPDKNAPCCGIANKFVLGDLNDFDSVCAFGREADVVSIEIENVNVQALKQLEKEGREVYPQPHIIDIIQDKGAQKEFFLQHGIPTSGFFLVEDKSQIARYREHFPFFQKLRRGGYDGKGVVKLSDAGKLEHAFDAPSVLEKLVDLETEISVIVARNKGGEVKTFPVVECAFSEEAHLVEYLFSPAGISPAVAEKANGLAVEVAERLGIVGLLAVEMFVTKNDEVLVNELAPRPHNSGHHTIEGNITSQFEQHLRAILNLPLGDTSVSSPAVMLNLLGEKGHDGLASYQGLEEVLQMSGVHVHLYGKANTRPFRKMGHVTVTADTLAEARAKALRVRDLLKVVV